MIVYVDVLIVINILVNYFMLLAVKTMGRFDTTRWRILLGAIIGGASSLLLFLDNLGIVMTLLKILSAFLMSAITFGIKPIKKLLKSTFWLFAICFVFGGLMFAIYMFTEIDIMLYKNGIIYFDIDITFLVICSAISYIVITIIAKLTDKKAPKSKEYYIKIETDKKIISCRALMDTGNNLREPFSNYPVILAEKSIFEELFEADDKIRLIPVSTVSGETLLKAYRPKQIEIENFKTDKVYIAESLAPLDEYKIILNINLEGEMQND